jgi:hypothetical protein
VAQNLLEIIEWGMVFRDETGLERLETEAFYFAVQIALF